MTGCHPAQAIASTRAETFVSYLSRTKFSSADVGFFEQTLSSHSRDARMIKARA